MRLGQYREVVHVVLLDRTVPVPALRKFSLDQRLELTTHAQSYVDGRDVFLGEQFRRSRLVDQVPVDFPVALWEFPLQKPRVRSPVARVAPSSANPADAHSLTRRTRFF
jgi:hypothetical protein